MIIVFAFAASVVLTVGVWVISRRVRYTRIVRAEIERLKSGIIEMIEEAVVEAPKAIKTARTLRPVSAGTSLPAWSKWLMGLAWLPFLVVLIFVGLESVSTRPPPLPQPTPTPVPAPLPKPTPTSVPAPLPQPIPTPVPAPTLVPTAPLGSISGYVYQSDRQSPISNLGVYATDFKTNEKKASANTDAKGYYVLSGLPEGSYRVGTWTSGSGLSYIDEWYDNTRNQNEAKPVVVSARGDTPNISFSLELGGTISGKVIADASLNSIANLHVFASDYGTNEWMAGVNTRADGTYTLSGLPAGTYRVKAAPSANNLLYADEYYDNTYDYNKAQQVTVTVGRDTPGINFSLAPGGTVSGVVRNADGSAPLANVSVECYRIVNGKWEWWNAITDSQGKYTIYGVPYGDFAVRAPGRGRGATGDGDLVQEYYSEKSGQSQATVVTVASGVNPTNVNFTLSIGGSISGKVIADASLNSIANLHVFASDYGTNEWMAGVNTRADGTYTLSGLPAGTYRVKAAPSNNNLLYADEYYDNTYDYSKAQRVTVTVGQDTTGINFSLATTAK